MNDKSTILIVDDQKVMRETIGMLLAKEDYELIYANDGHEALRRASQVIPDVILLDIMMPGMDGFEVCRHLREHPVLAEVPIIMVTALNDRKSWMEGIEAGADDFVFKPFDTVELRTRVQNITRLNRYRRLIVERTKFEWVLDQANDGYLMLDEEGQIVYANPQARLFLDLAVDDVQQLEESFIDLAGKLYHFEPKQAWEDWPGSPVGDVPRYLVRPESPHAKPFWLRVRNLNLPTGVDVQQVISLRDVTEQMELQRDVWRFHSMIFHKLRTPLAVMMNSLELLSRHADKLGPDKSADVAQRALQGTRRLQAEVDDILKYLKSPNLARVGTGLEVMELEEVIRHIGGELEIGSLAVAGTNKLFPARMRLSREAMESILWEVLENAKKFHPQHEPAVQIFLFLMKTHEIGIWIGDDGLTLSPEQLAQVWTPYYQGEKAFTGEVTGMGLGLPMVASLIWGVGGRCRMYNRPGEPGVIVELIVPTEEAAPATNNQSGQTQQVAAD
ncbi:MAG TPA: response regulator [Candidatus Binatia bacterium]|jgi:DNA-binding response OmpR family regulator|nr:response regulator [Candidatus Binatia bacterium]